MGDQTVKERVRELTRQDYSQYMISTFLNIPLAEVGRMRGVYYPSKGEADAPPAPAAEPSKPRQPANEVYYPTIRQAHAAPAPAAAPSKPRQPANQSCPSISEPNLYPVFLPKRSAAVGERRGGSALSAGRRPLTLAPTYREVKQRSRVPGLEKGGGEADK
jgi:hypothetical protein